MKKELKLYRCIFMKENSDYIIGKDIFNAKIYHIRKSNQTLGFKIGSDSSFYASREENGMIFKKTILNVVKYEKIIKMAGK